MISENLNTNSLIDRSFIFKIVNEISDAVIFFNDRGEFVFSNKVFIKNCIDNNSNNLKYFIDSPPSFDIFFKEYKIGKEYKFDFDSTKIFSNTLFSPYFKLTIISGNLIMIMFKLHTSLLEYDDNLKEKIDKLEKENSKLKSNIDSFSEAISEIAQKESYYRHLLQDSLNGIIISDFSGNILTVNNQALKIIEYSENEVQSLNIRDLFTEFELQRNPFQYEAIKYGEKILKERFMKSKSGKQIPIEMKSCILSQNKIQTIIRDITKEKEANYKLVQSEKKYRELVENISDVIFECDTEFNFVFYNGALEFLGYNSKLNLFNIRLIDLIHPEDKIIFNEEIDNICANRHVKLEMRLASAMGEYIWTRLNIHCKNNEGIHLGFFGTISDISKQKIAELRLKEKNEELLVFNEEYLSQNEELRTIMEEVGEKNTIIQETLKKMEQRKELFKTITENIPDIISRIDCKGCHIYISSNVKKQTSLDYTEFINKHILDVPDVIGINKIVNDNFEKTIKSRQPHTYIYYFSRNEIEMFLEGRMIPEFDNENKLMSVLHILRDVTKEKVTEQELIISKEKAEEAALLKNAFLANMSHEIRTPLNGIIGFSNLLYDDDISKEEQKQYVDTINSCSSQLLTIISDIIDISKIEAKQIDIIIADCNINAVMKSLLVMFSKEKERLRKNKIEIHLSADSTKEQLVIDTDESRLKQILSNLLNNALKFTDNGKIEFGYKINNNNLLFFVSDTGLGIPKNNLSLIFERFRQSNPQRDQLYGGTGLGLSISKGLVELLNGNMWVESEVDKGTTFYFTLPYKELTFVSDVNKLKVLKPNLSGKTILIVEDTIYSQQYFLAIFKKTDANVIILNSGEEAVKYFEDNKHADIVLMDIQLPGISGLEACKKIKKINTKIHIIAQTANAMSKDRYNAIEWGCSDYISKPIKKAKLFNLIQEYIL